MSAAATPGAVIIAIVTPWIILVGALVLLLRRFFLGYRANGRHYSVLARREVALVESAAEVFFPSNGAIPVSGLETDLPGYVDRLLSALDARLRWQIRLLLVAVEHTTLLIPAPGLFGFRRFSSLSFEAREAVFQRWSKSRYFVRQLIFSAFRSILTLGYLGHPDVMRYLRVAPLDFETPIVEADLLYPPIGQHPDAMRLRESDLTPPSDGTPIDIDGPLHPDFLEGKL